MVVEPQVRGVGHVGCRRRTTSQTIAATMFGSTAEGWAYGGGGTPCGCAYGGGGTPCGCAYGGGGTPCGCAYGGGGTPCGCAMCACLTTSEYAGGAVAETWCRTVCNAWRGADVFTESRVDGGCAVSFSRGNIGVHVTMLPVSVLFREFFKKSPSDFSFSCTIANGLIALPPRKFQKYIKSDASSNDFSPSDVSTDPRFACNSSTHWQTSDNVPRGRISISPPSLHTTAMFSAANFSESVFTNVGCNATTKSFKSLCQQVSNDAIAVARLERPSASLEHT
jgi:hypothetical protein